MDSRMDAGKTIALLVQEACIREVCAPKPGNVNRIHDFPDTTFEDFLVSALAIGPAFENISKASVGEIILQATIDCRRRMRSNTNLGIVLLLAPLAKAAYTVLRHAAPGSRSRAAAVRHNLNAILSSLTVEDACLVYNAVRFASPAGLGEVPEQDISGEPTVTLREAMKLAKDRDSVASEYLTNYAITFEIGLPALREALSRETVFSNAVVHTFLSILSKVPDSLIERKKDAGTARTVSKKAEHALMQGGIFSLRGKREISDLDRFLHDCGNELNPGTTADLTAAVIFLALIEKHPVGPNVSLQ